MPETSFAATSGSTRAPSATGLVAASPINMAALIDEVDAFLEELKALGETTHPKDLFAKHGGDKFVDCVLVAESERDTHKASIYHFENTIDRIRHLHQMRAQWQDGSRSFLIPAVSRWNTRDHAVYEELATRSGKASAVVLESTVASIGLSVLKDYIVAHRDYPESTPSVTVLVTGAQKTTYGCSAYSITYGFDHARQEMRTGLDAIHEQHFARDRKVFRLVIDLLGTNLHWSTYRQVQSRTHVEQICERHGLDGISLPRPNGEDSGETLLEYHDRHRVTQDVTDQETRRAVRKTFSNAVDRTRIQRLERLAAYLRDLATANGAEDAGRIFAEKLARVRLSRPADWDACLSEVRQLAPAWDTRKGFNQVSWKACSPLKKLEIFEELLNALPQWQSAPTVRRDALVVMGAIFNDLLPQAESLEAEIFTALTGVPQVVKELAAHVHEQNELDYVLWLLYAFLRHAGAPQRSDVIRALLPLAAEFVRDSFKAQFIGALEACADGDPVCAAAIGESKRALSEAGEMPGDRFCLCYGCGQESTELVAALDVETMDVLLNVSDP